MIEFLGYFFFYYIYLWKGIVLSCADLKKNFKGVGGLKGFLSLLGGSRYFWGYLIFIIFKRLLLLNIRIYVLILIEDLYFMYMIILLKDFF